MLCTEISWKQSEVDKQSAEPILLPITYPLVSTLTSQPKRRKRLVLLLSLFISTPLAFLIVFYHVLNGAHVILPRFPVVTHFELGAGSFPAVVAPKIHRRVFSYRLFQALEVHVCYAIVFKLLGFVRQQLEIALVISSPFTRERCVEHHLIHTLHDTFRTSKHRRIVVKEI